MKSTNLRTKTEKGITLVALIITIVVLLILAVVAINSIKNEGIMSKAERSADNYKVAQDIETLRLAYEEYDLQSITGTPDQTFEEMITASGLGTTENRTEYLVEGLEAIIVTMKDSNKTYRVLSNGNIAEIDLSWWDGELDWEDRKSEYVLTTAAQLVGFEQLVNEGEFCNENPSGSSQKTVKLGNNIDLSGIDWIPMGTYEARETYNMVFNQVFDGQGYTISNLKTRNYETCYDAAAGFFGVIGGATIKNVTLKNVQVEGTHYVGAVVGYIKDKWDVTNEIINCHVDGGTITSTPTFMEDINQIDGGHKVGGIAGWLYFYNKLQGCSVKNVTITAYRDIGGILGFAYSNCVVSDNTVGENVNIIVNNSQNFEGYTSNDQYNVDSIVGRVYGTESGTFTGNTGTATIRFPY